MSNETHPHSPTATDTLEAQRREAAERYVEGLRVFYVHVGVFAAGMVVIFLVNLFTNIAAGLAGEWWAWWSGWALIGWGLAIAVHGLVVRISRPRSGTSSWEERQIDKLLSSKDTDSIR